MPLYYFYDLVIVILPMLNVVGLSLHVQVGAFLPPFIAKFVMWILISFSHFGELFDMVYHRRKSVEPRFAPPPLIVPESFANFTSFEARSDALQSGNKIKADLLIKL